MSSYFVSSLTTCYDQGVGDSVAPEPPGSDYTRSGSPYRGYASVASPHYPSYGASGGSQPQQAHQHHQQQHHQHHNSQSHHHQQQPQQNGGAYCYNMSQRLSHPPLERSSESPPGASMLPSSNSVSAASGASTAASRTGSSSPGSYSTTATEPVSYISSRQTDRPTKSLHQSTTATTVIPTSNNNNNNNNSTSENGNNMPAEALNCSSPPPSNNITTNNKNNDNNSRDSPRDVSQLPQPSPGSDSSSGHESSGGGNASSQEGGSPTTPNTPPQIYPWMRRMHMGHSGKYHYIIITNINQFIGMYLKFKFVFSSFMSIAIPSTKIHTLNAKHLYYICTTSHQRRRRWGDVVQMLYRCFVLMGAQQTWTKAVLMLGQCRKRWSNMK